MAQMNDDQSGFSFSFEPDSQSTAETHDSPMSFTESRSKRRRRNESTSSVAANRHSPLPLHSPFHDSNREQGTVTTKTDVVDPSLWSSVSFSDAQPFSFSKQTIDRMDDDEKGIEATAAPRSSKCSKASVASSEAMKFEFTTKSMAQKALRKLELPDFDRLEEIESNLNIVQSQIKDQQQILQCLREKEQVLIAKKDRRAMAVAEWISKYDLWNADDFISWIFQIDGGYFKMKCKINQKQFEPKRFCETLNQIASRFQFGSTLWTGQSLSAFDILDCQQLFPFLDAKDCRKLFYEIERLTKSLRDRVDMKCPICTTKRKQYALSCGHVFCERCIHKMTCCAFCKKIVDKSKMIKIYL